MAKAKGSVKGGRFEREIPKLLSMWWTEGERDDVFWRVGGSGGRAKVRGRKGQSTANQHSDICATDSCGESLTKFMAIELKCGYNDVTFHNLLERSEDQVKGHKLFEWIEQVQEAQKQSGAMTWCIIHKRDRHNAIMIVPIMFHVFLEKAAVGAGSFSYIAKNRLRFDLPHMSLFAVQLSMFLETTSRATIEESVQIFHRDRDKR